MTEPGLIGVYFNSGDYRLLGTLFLASGSAPKPTALLLHGMPGIEKNYDLALCLREKGWNSLIFHYRGCWGSQGVYNFRSIPGDVGAAIDELCRGKYPQVDTSRIALIGHSLGGWAAILAAARDERVKAVAAVAAIANPADMDMNREAAEKEFCPWIPNCSPEDFLTQWQGLDQSYTPLAQAAKISPRPLLILHGAADRLVPITQSEALFRSATEPKEFHTHPTADHGFTWQRQWLLQTISCWLASAVVDTTQGVIPV